MRIFTPQNEYVMRKLLYLVIGLLFVFALPSGAQPECVFTHYSSEEGLSQNTVMNILQDRKGNMWFATWDGINKFDGYDFRTYKAKFDNRSTPNKHLKLRLKSISFRPDVRLKQAMTGVSAIRSKYTRHSLKLSEVEIDMKLKEYFADHDVLIRSDFQALCGMARTTANVHLKRLQQEGKLKNVGKPTQPIYRAMPGYYGVSRDAKAGR